ncbi:MAG: hypothetical protein KC440_02225 [Nitrosarchaeum sp.]|nr:hypothetical protein [Nitrosarchaeum sp.]
MIGSVMISLIFLILTGFVIPVFAEPSEFTVAEMYWKEAAFPSSEGSKATITVKDHDMNLHPNIIDYVWISVYSDTDRNGFRMTIFETDFDSGIFEGTVTFAHTPPSGGGFLHTAEGDTIFAGYTDTRLPANYTVPESASPTEQGLEFFSSAIVGGSSPPLERVPASHFRLLDLKGDSIQDNLIAINQQVRLVTDLENQMEHLQRFAYLVLIQNEKNQAESLSWITGNLTSSQRITSDATWIPFKGGTYTATVFVWESIDNPTALSPPLSMEINVRYED